jgi:hypothetical protein
MSLHLFEFTRKSEECKLKEMGFNVLSIWEFQFTPTEIEITESSYATQLNFNRFEI